MICEESCRYFKALGAHIMLRNARDLTEAALARAIGISQQPVFAYELGEPRVSVLLLTKIARVFSISVAELVGMARPVPVAKVSPRALHDAKRLQAPCKADERFVVRLIDTIEREAR